MADIIVFIEHDADGITDLSLQCLGRARKLGGSVGCLLLGDQLDALTGLLIERGADVVYTVSDSKLGSYLTKPFAEAALTVLQQHTPTLLLLPASTIGNDLAPVLAARLATAAILDCCDVQCDNGSITAKRLEFDAKAYTLYKPATDGVAIVTAKDGIDEAAPSGAAGGETVAVEVIIGDDAMSTTIDKREVARKTVNLKDAKVIIGGGAGVGNAENFELLEKLSAKLGGEIGATRASVDAGWVSHERQIGQTGVTVRPDLYIACGISGAVQHVVGIRDAKTIVAINSDPSAPIFKMAHYRIVGDLNDIVPKLIDLI